MISCLLIHLIKKDDEVKGRVYEISDNFGVFVAVDDQYSALIPKKERRLMVFVWEKSLKDEL